MFKHIVCFKFFEREQAPIVKEKLENLMGKIPTLRSIECGVDILNTQRSYDLVLITTFDDKQGYYEYDKHPDHQQVRSYIHPVREKSVAIDFEF